MTSQAQREIESRAFRASNALHNAALEVLRGQRSGRIYKTPQGSTYQASAPGEAPAARTGTLRREWRQIQHGPDYGGPAIESVVPYASLLEEGTPGGMIQPRPFKQPILEKAWPEVETIYSEPYNLTP